VEIDKLTPKEKAGALATQIVVAVVSVAHNVNVHDNPDGVAKGVSKLYDAVYQSVRKSIEQ
jgi:hypothetical protein